MAAVWRRAGASNAQGYLARLLDGTTPVDALVNELVIGETYFFRDAGQFAVLQTEIFPELRSRRGRGLMMWSAGCATGEEAYSLAIAAAASAPDGAQDRVFATDVSTRSLAIARAGQYGSWSMRGVSAETIDRISVRRDKEYEVRARWRNSVEFGYGNLAETPAVPMVPGAMDLILCRNVLIYLDEGAVQRAAALLFGSLRDGGYLLTAPSDPPLWNLAPFKTLTTSAGIVYRRVEEASLPKPSTPAGDGAALPPAAGPSLAHDARMPRSDRVQRRRQIASIAPTALERAEAAMAAGAWAEAARLTAGLDDEPRALIHVRTTANARGTSDAERACAGAVLKYPTSTALHHVHALLLLALDRLDDAAAAERRVLFLDSMLSAGHLALATIARRAGDLVLARRSYRNARDLLRGEPEDALVPLADGQRAGALRRAAEAELASLDHRARSRTPTPAPRVADSSPTESVR